MATAPILPPVSVEDYFNSGMQAEWEYVDGELVRRHNGTYRHSTIVMTLGRKLGEFNDIIRTQAGLVLWTAERHYRVPDVTCFLRSVRPDPDAITKEPPLAVFEIVSTTDPMLEIRRKCAEYRQIGVPHIVLIDAIDREVLIPARGLQAIGDVIEFAAGDRNIRIPVADLFADLDD